MKQILGDTKAYNKNFKLNNFQSFASAAMSNALEN